MNMLEHLQSESHARPCVEASPSLLEDISEKKVSEPQSTAPLNHLLSDKELFLIDQMQEAVCMLTRSFQVVCWNTAMEQLSGVERGDAVGKYLFNLLPTSFYEQLREKLVATFEKKGVENGEFYQTHNGSERFVFQYRVSWYDSQTNDSHGLVLLSLLDVTDRFRLQNEREKQEHFATLSALSVNVAQELAAPLDEICLLVDRLLTHLRGVLGEANFHKHLNGIISQVYRISYLSHNLVALTQQGTSVFVPLHLNELILDTLDSWEHEGNSRPIVNLQIDEHLPAVAGDPLLMQSAIQMLTKISLEFAGEDAVPRITTTYLPAENTVKIIFENRGPNIPNHDLEHLFEWYYGNTIISPGSSLGLFISKKAIEAQRGTFKISSMENQGTIFEISFPVLR